MYQIYTVAGTAGQVKRSVHKQWVTLCEIYTLTGTYLSSGQTRPWWSTGEGAAQTQAQRTSQHAHPGQICWNENMAQIFKSIYVQNSKHIWYSYTHVFVLINHYTCTCTPKLVQNEKKEWQQKWVFFMEDILEIFEFVIGHFNPYLLSRKYSWCRMTSLSTSSTRIQNACINHINNVSSVMGLLSFWFFNFSYFQFY